jgi:hypothetical protein
MSNEQKVRQLTTSWARGENARLFSGLPISRLKTLGEEDCAECRGHQSAEKPAFTASHAA